MMLISNVQFDNVTYEGPLSTSWFQERVERDLKNAYIGIEIGKIECQINYLFR
mgnify:CR=1 FL=1